MTKYLQTKPGSIEELAAKMSSKVNEGEYQQLFKKELEKAGKGVGAMTPKEKSAFFSKIDSKYKAKNEEVAEAVNPYAVGMAQAMKSTGDKPPLKKATITKAHDIAKSIEKDQKEEVKEEKETCPKCEGKGCEHCDMKGYHIKEAKVDELTAAQKKLPPALQKAIKDKEDKEVKETHTFVKDKQNQKQKDAKGEKDIVDPEPKLKKEEVQPNMNEQTASQHSILRAIHSVWTNSANQLEELKKNAKYMKSEKEPEEENEETVKEATINVDNVKKGDSEKEKELKIKLDKEKDQDTLEKQLISAQGQINILKQKLENEKNKSIKPEPNPKTGEVPLTVGVAYKIMKDKLKKESDDKEQNKNKKTMTDKPKTPVDTSPNVDYKF